MHQITSAQFKAEIELDPAWASKLTEPVEITDYCHMTRSQITHLSPLLHFTGKNKDGDCANFSDCKLLRIAEGKFEGCAIFTGSGIEKIGDLTCGKDKNGYSASFWGCKSLKVATGEFEGYVNFSYSNIKKIGDITCGKNKNGIRLGVIECLNLSGIPFTFNPREIEASPKIIEKLEVARFIQKKRAEIVEIEI